MPAAEFSTISRVLQVRVSDSSLFCFVAAIDPRAYPADDGRTG
jgi:hypothetical protein